MHEFAIAECHGVYILLPVVSISISQC